MNFSKFLSAIFNSSVLVMLLMLNTLSARANDKNVRHSAKAEPYSSCAHGSSVSDCSTCNLTASADTRYSRYAAAGSNRFVLTEASYYNDEYEEDPAEDPIPEEDNNRFPWGWIVGGTWILWFIAKGENKQ